VFLDSGEDLILGVRNEWEFATNQCDSFVQKRGILTGFSVTRHAADFRDYAALQALKFLDESGNVRLPREKALRSRR
jgi:hypothetical protein